MQATMYILMTLFVIVSLFLILLILIQKGRGGGLSGAFGGAGGNTAFGSKTGDVLTWATSVVFGIFLLIAVLLNLFANHMSGTTTAAVVPAVPPTTQPASTAPPTGDAALPSSSGLPGDNLPATPDFGSSAPLVPVSPAPSAPTAPAPTTQR